MNLVAIDTRLVSWPLDGSGAARGRRERSALLVEVRTLAGAIGLGEAAPLAAMSNDTLDDVVRSIGALRASMPLDLADDLTALGMMIEHFSPAPSARFALETAILSALAVERGISLAQLLGAAAGARPGAAGVGGVESAQRAGGAGVRCLKIKSQANDDLSLARAITTAIPGARIRIDANRSWPEEVVRDRLAALAGLPIDFVEEPCVASVRLLAEQLPCRIALDESLATLGPDELAGALRSPSLAAVVLKPTLLGGLTACLALAARAREAGVPAIVTHMLEGPIGTAACAELALAVAGDDQVPGLASHPGLAAWRIAIPQLVPAGIRASGASGLGFGGLGLATLLAAIDPTPRKRTPSPSPSPLSSASRQDAALSIVRAAIDHPSAPAIVTADDTITFADAAVGASQRSSATRPGVPGAPRRARTVLAAATLDTISAIHGALDADWPIALLHPKLPEAELARQRELVAAATFERGDAIVLFTSGSTGAPRGVVLTRKAILAAADASSDHVGWNDDDRWLIALPLAHAGGLAPVVRCRVARNALVVAGDDEPRADALARATIASLVPTQLAALLEDPHGGRPPGCARSCSVVPRRPCRCSRRPRAAASRSSSPTGRPRRSVRSRPRHATGRAIRARRSSRCAPSRSPRAPARARSGSRSVARCSRHAISTANRSRPSSRPRTSASSRTVPSTSWDASTTSSSAVAKTCIRSRSRPCSRPRPASRPLVRSRSPTRGGDRSSASRWSPMRRSIPPPPPRAGMRRCPRMRDRASW
ncbi:MAG: enolase C-terminal domain-like protein [Kofleriaceae bacterium]